MRILRCDECGREVEIPQRRGASNVADGWWLWNPFYDDRSPHPDLCPSCKTKDSAEPIFDFAGASSLETR
jgi:hypothetical protein